MKARYIKREWENAAKTIATFYFAPDRPYYFTAGQYADITISHDAPDRRGPTRTMTFSSDPGAKLLGFTTRISPNPYSTYKQALLGLRPNDAVTITDAMGDMVLPLDASMPLVFVAGGVGIASYASMVSWLTQQQDKRDITLLYAVNNTDDIIFQPQFTAYARVGTMSMSLYTTDHKAESASWEGNIVKSRITASDIQARAKPDAQIYLSGTESMVEQLRQELQRDHGIPQYRLVFDYFEGYIEI